MGSLPDVRRDPIGFYLDATKRYGGIVRFRYGRKRSWHLVAHPNLVEYVLQTNVKNYPKGYFFNTRLKTLTGNGLLTSEGDFWLRQRRLAAPAFHRQSLAQLTDAMTGPTQEMLDRWKACPATRPLDVSEEMMRLTLQIVGRSLFKAELGTHAETVYQSLTGALEHINHRMRNPLSPPEHIPTPRNRAFKKDRQALDDVALGIIQGRRQTGEENNDLLAMLMAARDADTGEGMNDTQLLDEVRTLMLTGHETTAVALAWTWKLLARHPEVRQKMQDEIDQVLQGRIPTLDDLPQLRYTRMIFDEALRLYPPVWGITRQAVNNDEIGGYTINAGSTIVILPYVTHRLEEFWPNPDVFDPERFNPDQPTTRPRFAYFPFGGGPRLCIGQNFALMEAQIILAMITQKFQLDLVPEHPIALSQSLTLRPRYGLKMTLRPRH